MPCHGQKSGESQEPILPNIFFVPEKFYRFAISKNSQASKVIFPFVTNTLD